LSTIYRYNDKLLDKELIQTLDPTLTQTHRQC